MPLYAEHGHGISAQMIELLLPTNVSAASLTQGRRLVAIRARGTTVCTALSLLASAIGSYTGRCVPDPGHSIDCRWY